MLFRSEQEIRASAETQMDKLLHNGDAPAEVAANITEGYDLYDLRGVGVKLIAALQAANLSDLKALGAMAEADLAAVAGIGDKAGKILKAVNNLLAEAAAEQAAPAAADPPAAAEPAPVAAETSASETPADEGKEPGDGE